MELATVKDAFDHIAKKQKLSSSKSEEVVDQINHEIEQALAKIQSVVDPISPVVQKAILSELKQNLSAVSPLSQLEGSQKELNMNLSKYHKLVEKSFNPNISKAYRSVEFDFHIVNQIIACHFFWEGLFDLGDCLINEAEVPEASALRSHFLEIYQILEAFRLKNLEPALNWVTRNSEKLKLNDSKIELKLHALQFVEILKKGSGANALNYARTWLAPLVLDCLKEFQKIMVCILWRGRLERYPYSELLASIQWDKLAEELRLDLFNLMGLSYGSPLIVAIAAGIEGLPTLLKLANVMAAKKQEWEEMKQLPVPVELGREFQFHSIFVCPVSRDSGSEDNPPILMPCLHVLCKQSIMKPSEASSRTFKCPYCPAEASIVQCRQLHF